MNQDRLPILRQIFATCCGLLATANLLREKSATDGLPSERLLETTPWFSDFFGQIAALPLSTMIAVAVLMIGTGFLSQSLISNGKSGWGWFTLCVVGTILAFVGKIALSMFIEVSSSDPIPRDWDEDD